MPIIAIIGAGPVGGALAHKLAARSRVAEVRLVDPEGPVARGKALDILQAGPVEGFGTLVSAQETILAAAGADVIVLADSVAGVEHAGETGLATVRHLVAAGAAGPIVFAGAAQRQLMSRCATELHLPPARLIGSAPMALASALRALSAVVLDGSAVEISLTVVGVPPSHTVVAWQEATVSGQPLPGVMAAHEIALLSARINGLWPPGPYALASAAARVAEALCSGSRRHYSCFVDLGRGRIAAMPVELKRGGLGRILEPVLTSQERTAFENALAADEAIRR
jgi:malate dehydrogenase